MNRRREQRGQASLIGLVAVVVLAIAMYVSYSLSRTVYDKIALQNAADATAYALATQSARSFNFIAFTNRALIAKQIELLELHAEVSQTSYSVGFIGYLGDLALSYAVLLRGIPGGAAAATVIEPVGRLFEQLHTSREHELQGKLRALEAALQGEPAFSRLYMGMAAALVASTAARLLEGAPDIATKNDADAQQHPLSAAFGAYNVFAYLDVFEEGALEGELKSQRAFAEVVNASRFAARHTPRTILWRNGVMDELVTSLEELSDAVPPDRSSSDSAGAALQELTRGSPGLGFVGTSKLLTRVGEFAALEDTGSAADERSYLSRGDVMVSKDTRTGFRFTTALARAAEQGWASLQSTADGYRYCRYQKPTGYGTRGSTRLFTLLTDAAGSGFECTEDAGYRLRWRGLGHYLRFKSMPRTGARLHNQPDVWVFLSKPGRARELLGDSTKPGSGSGSFDPGASEFQAIARAQVYYHRPGAWREPPNFFNPYWGARLAPKSDASEDVLARLGFDGELAEFFSDNAVLF